jgi:3-methyladenine DNA glycosylase AlkD
MTAAILIVFFIFVALMVAFVVGIARASIHRANQRKIRLQNIRRVGMEHAEIRKLTLEKLREAKQHGAKDAIDLEKLADLRAKGIITEEEFTTKKKQILGI